jgi:UDP-GlcNAc:undecaprenyl-phosphate GlcNAc-1-phosphate transferase
MDSWFVLQASTITAWLTLPFALALTLILIPPIKHIAQRLRFVSKIDFRRRELVPRPLLGGIAIFIALVVANSFCNVVPWSLVLPGFGLVLLGAVDDKLQINAKLKMICEIACVVLWLAMSPTESLLLVRIGLPVWLAYAIHAFWVVGLINAFNMIDGMDGLASGMATLGFAFLGFFLPAELSIFAWSASAAAFGHLLYNRPPAAIFLGDSGSLLLGFLLSALGSIVVPNELHMASALIPLFILAHPEIDAILAIVRRKRAGTPLFQGDKDHIHHKLRRIGLSANASLAVTYFATVYCGLTAVLLDSMHANSWTMALAAALCIFGVSTILAALYYVEYRLAAQFSQIGTPLLQKHINITKEPRWPVLGTYQAVVFDLLPYYKEMQERGIAELNDFVNDFSKWINGSFADCQIVPAGSYSIIILRGGILDRELVLKSFKEIISNHGLLKNAVGIPWGLHFYADSTDAQAFERKFGLFLRSGVVISNKAA